MISRDGPFFWNVTCDHCGAELDPQPTTDDCPDFDDVIAEMKCEGWANVKEKFGWENLCPDCGE